MKESFWIDLHLIFHCILQFDMTNILNINIGQAGVRIADHFWTSLRAEHAINDPNPFGRPQVFFQQKNQGWESRSIFIDLDQRHIDQLQTRNSSIYNPHYCMSFSASSRGISAESAYQFDIEITNQIMDRVRKKVERCDRLSGFIVLSSLGGGTSSGLGSRVMSLIRQQYQNRIMQSFKLMPDIANAHPLEIYNTTYAIQQDSENSDLSIMFDNGWAERALINQRINRSMENDNAWIGQKIAESTIPFRFSGQLNSSQHKMAYNLIPFPRIHFFALAQASSLSSALNFNTTSLTNFYSPGARTFSLYAGVRDTCVTQQESNSCIRQELSRQNIEFAAWMQNPVHLSLHDPVSLPNATVMVNSQNMSQYFQHLAERFIQTYCRQGFIHWYYQAGMDDMEFDEMESNINDLANAYWRRDDIHEEQGGVQYEQ